MDESMAFIQKALIKGRTYSLYLQDATHFSFRSNSEKILLTN